MEINWAQIQEASKASYDRLLSNVRDMLADDSVDVTCQLLSDLGIEPHPATTNDFEDARSAVQSFVEIALLGLGMFGDGSPFPPAATAATAATASEGTASRLRCTYWVPTQYDAELVAAQVAEAIASGEITEGDAMDSSEGEEELVYLARAIMQASLLLPRAGEPVDTDTPESFHVYVSK